VAGGRIDILVEPDTRGFDTKLGQKLRGIGGVASTVGKGIGVAIAGGTAVAAVGLKNAIELGIEYTGKLNEMQSVSGATAAQMVQVGLKAKDLGADLSLPATSAAGAASAMLELAKGGLSVDQAMTAAKGTLQLAAAAQVDAATAAEIQSNALNEFGLSADKAGKVADVLANTANAASGGILDIANALKYVGPIARSVGAPIEDTAAAIGLLANNGIQSEQAGTSLRSMIASLASPSKAAAKALGVLNVEAFDTEGKFVGLRSIVEQLSKAKGTLTAATFQQAAADAFGNEALSAVNALANEGAASFDEMRVAVDRQGGASEVAAAKMKGLGGAWEGFKSQLETAGIEIFEVIDGPLEAIVRKASDVVQNVTPSVKRALDGVISAGQLFGPGLAAAIGSRASALADVGERLLGPLVKGVKETVGNGIDIAVQSVKDFGEVAAAVVDEFEPLAHGVGDVLESFNRADGPIGAFAAALGLAYDAAKFVVGLLGPVVSLVADVAHGFAGLPGPIQTAALALLALKAGPSILSTLKNAFSKTGEEADGAAKKTGIFGKTIGLIAAPVRLVGSGLSTAVGGFKNFGQEMELQRALAKANGDSVGVLGGAYEALQRRVSGATLSFRQSMDAIQSSAEAFGQPVSRLNAAMQVLAQRSETVAKARDSFRSTFDSVSQSADRAALSMGVATQEFGSNLTNALSRAREAFSNTGSTIAGFGDRIRSGISSAVTGVSTGVSSMVTAVRTIPTAVGVAAISLQERLAGAARSVGEAFASVPGKIAALPTALGVGFIGALEKIPGAITGTVSALGRFGAAAAGAATAAGSLIKSAGAGLVNALGGGWGIALAGASIGLGLLASAQERAAKRAAENAAQQRTFMNALIDSNGAVNTAIINMVKLELINRGLAGPLKQLGFSMEEAIKGITQGGPALDLITGKIQTQAGETSNASKFWQLLGIETDKNLGGNVKLKGALDDLHGAFNGALEGQKDYVAGVSKGSQSMLEATSSGRDFAAAMGVLGDKTASADSKAKALKDALDALSGGQVSLDKATAQVNEQFDRLGDTFGKNVDKSKGFGSSLLTNAGRINTTTENGRALRDSLEEITTSTVTVAQRTFDMTGSLGDAQKVVQDSRDRFIGMAEKMGISASQAGVLADQMGLIPEQVATLIQTPGMTDAQKEIVVLQGMIHRTPGQKEIVLKTLSAEAESLLESFGFKVTHLKDGQVSINLESDAAKREMDAFVNKPRTAIVRVSTVRSAGGGLGVMHDGGILRAYADGGFEKRLNPMKGGVASIVPPNTWRVVGDRLTDDEAYIPINQSSRSLQILRQTADQMGFALLRRFATGGVAVSNGLQRQVPVPVGGPVVNVNTTVRDNDDAAVVAQTVSANTAWALRVRPNR
jgi:TP901 family phage tail tape measure protein